ncbi:MAG: hypothetical protein OEY85_13185, partial [Rhodospirillales bacterium]|nr:hypothetical protein [Rhodospirillales bacterium]
MADDVTIDFDDIQGFVVRGFGGLAHAGYLFFKIDDEAAFRTWLRERLSEYFFTPSTAREDVPAPAAALGLSASG